MSLARIVVAAVFVLAPALSLAQTTATPLDEAGIAKAMGRTGEKFGAGYKVSFPRSDLHVVASGVTITPALALGAWAAFLRTGSEAITYGDLVLLEKEINPVISKLEEHGIEVLALHNHLIGEKPHVMYIHFMGHGPEVELAKALRDAIALTGTPMAAPKPAAPEKTLPVTQEIARVIGAGGKMGGGVFHIVVLRKDVQVKMNGVDIPGNMGMNISLNFQLMGKKAAINGDFMLLAPEVNPVIRALRAHGIEVAALHNHMLDEQPRLFFMHYWAVGDAVQLAKGLKAALDETKAR